MSARRFAVCMAAFLLPWVAVDAARAQSQPAAEPEGRLVKLVLLSRHGVRSPTPSAAELASWSRSRWPVWSCGGNTCSRGELTPKGRMLAEQMGTFYKGYLADLVADTCPAPSDVFVWADVDERTQATGRALLSGFRPSCDGERYFHVAQGKRDRIFHPVGKGGTCRIDVTRAEDAILERAGGDIASYIGAQGLGREMSLAQKGLQCCDCARLKSPCKGEQTACSLAGMPSCVVPHDKGGELAGVRLGGSLRIASTYAEILLLEYANGFAARDVGWGRLSREELGQVLRLHTAAFDLEQRTPYIAALQGSMLMSKILLALRDRSDGRPGTAPPGAKVVAYVGHDTNIANLGGMLGLSWQQPGYQKDQPAPAGALLFELRETASGVRAVNVAYVAQSLDDMRNGTGTSPVRTPVPIPGCGAAGAQCPLADFAKVAEAALDRACTQ
jgi:4-phytase/acid phosphatase